jgi:hypothetical protein
MMEMIETLEARMAEEPDQPQGWIDAGKELQCTASGR